MNHRVTTGVSARGGALALKRSSTARDAARLEHEAAMLRLARHPGVVVLVACERDESGAVTLATEFVGLHSLDTASPLSVARAAMIVAAVAATLAARPERAIARGRVAPSHVLVGGNGQPKLCGFRASTADGSLEPSVDVAGAGEVLRELLTRARDDSRGRARRRALLAIADQANDPEPGRRPP